MIIALFGPFPIDGGIKPGRRKPDQQATHTHAAIAEQKQQHTHPALTSSHFRLHAHTSGARIGRMAGPLPNDRAYQPA